MPERLRAGRASSGSAPAVGAVERRAARWMGRGGWAVRNTLARFRAEDIERVLAVSRWYHLPRIKMTYARGGFAVLTVPAQEMRPLRKRHWFPARETASFWVDWPLPTRG